MTALKKRFADYLERLAVTALYAVAVAFVAAATGEVSTSLLAKLGFVGIVAALTLLSTSLLDWSRLKGYGLPAGWDMALRVALTAAQVFLATVLAGVADLGGFADTDLLSKALLASGGAVLSAIKVLAASYVGKANGSLLPDVVDPNADASGRHAAD